MKPPPAKKSRRKAKDLKNRSASPSTLSTRNGEAALAADGSALKVNLLVWGGLLTGLFFWSYWPTLVELVKIWEKEPDYSHGYLIAPLAIAFLWLRRDLFPKEDIRPTWLDFAFGLLLIGLSIAMRYVGALYFLGSVDGWSILLWMAGVVWLLGGWRIMYWSLPSIGFLFFMVPLPYRAESMLSYPLQRIAAKLSSAALQCLGQPAIREGNIIFLGEQKLEVEQACSGLRIFVAIVAMAFAYVILFRRSWWERALIIASAAPIALLANAVRIVVTGLLYQYVSGEAAHKFSHDFAGFAMIPLAAVMFSLFLWYLGKMFIEVQQVEVGALLNKEKGRI